MKRILICIFLLSAIFVTIFLIIKHKPITIIEHKYPNIVFNEYNSIMKRDILCLMMAYPEYITDVKRLSDGNIYIIMKSGKRILYDDKKTKTYDEKLNNPDLQDMMVQVYPLNDLNRLSLENFDPGRFRVYDLFHEVYGSSKHQIESKLTQVKFGSSNLSFNKNNNASDALKRVNSELEVLAKNQRKIASFAFPSSGTFNYRLIAGTKRLSEHSFGIAIDLAAVRKDYWQWASRKEGEKRLNSYPQSIVKVFENNNFIWGGKWGHFDLMHYEYRPEMILKAKYFSIKPVSGKSWFYGTPNNNARVNKYVDLIENRLQ
jgi:hypothetical protein